jgi:glutamate N-acetyltransferase / amino-acid N-acetyltransferase
MIKTITDIAGVYAGAIAAGIKPNRLDLAVIHVPKAVGSAAVFTTNKAEAACVTYSRKLCKRNILKAVVVNAGNANAATGDEGLQNAKKMGKLTAESLGLRPGEVGVASTGVIGVQLPIAKVEAGIQSLLSKPLGQDGMSAAKAIMTTDLTDKHVFVEAKIGKKVIEIAGIAKGSGMIAPNMGTMLGFLVTNADIQTDLLQTMLLEATQKSFNMVTVDGDTSTNDAVFLFATGERKINLNSDDRALFQSLLTEACTVLAKQIAKDGEGATKLIEIQVNGAASHRDAAVIAKTVGESPLVKTAVHGEDPNWGRVLAAVGRAPEIKCNQAKIDIQFAGTTVFSGGAPTIFDRDAVHQAMAADTIVIVIDMNLGKGSATAWGCDLTRGYVDINVAYS